MTTGRIALNHLAQESLERCMKRIFFFTCSSLSDSRNHAIFYQRLPRAETQRLKFQLVKMTRYPQQASHFYSFIMPDYPSYQRFIVGTEDAIPEVRQPLED